MLLRHSQSLILLLSPLLVVWIITVVLALHFTTESVDPTAGDGREVVEFHGPA